MSNRAPWPLTGRTRFRAGGFLNRRLVLQVQYVYRLAMPEGPTFDAVWLMWRDATAKDIGQLNAMRPQPIEVHLPEPSDTQEELPSARKPH